MRYRVLAAAVATALGCAVSARGQALDDPSLRLELVTALGYPTQMAFVAPDDILVLDKLGAVWRVLLIATSGSGARRRRRPGTTATRDAGPRAAWLGTTPR